MSREPRNETIRNERRRRADANLDRMASLKLAIPPEFKNDPVYDYRWINDDGDRVYSLTVQDDWDVCRLANGPASPEKDVRRPVGVKKDGSQMDAILVRKRKDWIAEDRAARSTANADREQALISRPETNDPQAGANTYVASGSSIKRRGAYAP